MFNFLKFLFSFNYKTKWEYGFCTCQHTHDYDSLKFSSTQYKKGDKYLDTKYARRNRFNGEVQFILWKTGDKQGNHIYTEPFWVNYHRDWWKGFVPNSYVINFTNLGKNCCALFLVNSFLVLINLSKVIFGLK